MSVTAGASMDCEGDVHVNVVNDTAGDFHGQSATASSWNVPIDLGPGASMSFDGHFGSHTLTLTGYVRGNSVEGYQNAVWTATRPEVCGAPTTTAPPPIDTTPHPLPTTPEDPTIYCAVPGANPPMKVPCDDPRATTPYAPPTAPTTAPAAPEPSSEAPAEPEAVTGPPRSHTTQAAKQHVTPVTALPPTGAFTGLLVLLALLCALIGTLCILVTRRRARAEEETPGGDEETTGGDVGGLADSTTQERDGAREHVA